MRTPDCRDGTGDDRCVTCSDEGREGEVLALGEPAVVRTDRGAERVDLCLVQGARPGDTVLIHAGLAIAVLPKDPR